MNSLNRSLVETKQYPTKVLQFGDGNFLRAFIDWMFQELNNQIEFNAGITIVKARPGIGKLRVLNDQNGLYTLFLKGIKDGKVKNEHQIIDCVTEGINPYDHFEHYFSQAANPNLQFLISNTTESGIVFHADDKLSDEPQTSFPAKVTALLYERYKIFKGTPDKGLIFFPCELIENNGEKLKEIILKYADIWGLDTNFKTWIHNHNTFCNTLVDRIVSGHPKHKIEEIQKKMGYTDPLLVEGEQYHLFVVETNNEEVQKRFPAERIGLNVIFTDNLKRYKTIKVRILNGAHTTLVPIAYLYGIDKVRESIEDPIVGEFLKKSITEEIWPTLDFSKEELTNYTNDVIDRFKNPYIEHELMSISLNSISKFKTRVLPSILEYIKRKNELPSNLLFSLASLIAFYRGDRNGTPIALKDDQNILDFFTNIWGETSDYVQMVQEVLSNTDFWGTDLTELDGLQKEVTTHLESIINNGMKTALEVFIK